MKYFLGLFFIGISAKAANYDCKVEENFKVVEKVKVTATDNQRIKVSSGENYVFYLSVLSQGLIELEAFLPTVEMRIYSKGNSEKNSVTLTSWQRDGFLEFTCSQN